MNSREQDLWQAGERRLIKGTVYHIRNFNSAPPFNPYDYRFMLKPVTIGGKQYDHIWVPGHSFLDSRVNQGEQLSFTAFVTTYYGKNGKQRVGLRAGFRPSHS